MSHLYCYRQKDIAIVK